MCETDEYDELEIEPIAAAHLFDDSDCDDERQIDENSDCRSSTLNHQNAGSSGCLILISTGLILTVSIVLKLLT